MSPWFCTNIHAHFLIHFQFTFMVIYTQGNCPRCAKGFNKMGHGVKCYGETEGLILPIKFKLLSCLFALFV